MVGAYPFRCLSRRTARASWKQCRMSGLILVFGAGGQLGLEMLALTRARGIDAKGLRRTEADITDPAAVERAVKETPPRLVLNAAAYTAVDKAEGEVEAAQASNVRGA